jgi:hypothetical protein
MKSCTILCCRKGRDERGIFGDRFCVVNCIHRPVHRVRLGSAVWYPGRHDNESLCNLVSVRECSDRPKAFKVRIFGRLEIRPHSSAFPNITFSVLMA